MPQATTDQVTTAPALDAEVVRHVDNLRRVHGSIQHLDEIIARAEGHSNRKSANLNRRRKALDRANRLRALIFDKLTMLHMRGHLDYQKHLDHKYGPSLRRPHPRINSTHTRMMLFASKKAAIRLMVRHGLADDPGWPWTERVDTPE